MRIGCKSFKMNKHAERNKRGGWEFLENVEGKLVHNLELVSKELNHFGVIADLFRQIACHSSRFVLFCCF